MLRRRPLILLTALATTLALVAAGCGGTTATVHELASFKQVQTASVAAGSARFSLKVETTIPGTQKSLSLTADGGFDTTSKRAQLTVDLSAFADLLKSLGQSFGGSVTGALPQGADAWKLDAIEDGTVVYVRFPLLADKLPPGKTWIRGDAKGLSAGSGQLGQFGSFADTDPRDVFGYLKAVSGTIVAVGSDEVRGVETSHYRATIDTKKLIALVPAAQRKGLAGFDQLVGGSGVASIPIDVWIDSDNRVRKLVLNVTATPSSTESAGASVEIEMYDYGKPLELELPPPEQVVDATSLRLTP
jgi:hypothetical protein